MRLGIRAKQIAGVTAIVGISVVLLSGLAAAMVSSLVMNESLSRGQMIARMIYQSAREVVPASPDPYVGLRDDPGLRRILQSSLYGESVTGAAVIDRTGIVVASSDSAMVGRPLPPSDDLEPIVKGGPIRQLQVIYSSGRTLEVRQQLILDDAPFGEIRIGVSTLLMRSALSGWLTQTLIVAVVALIVAVLVAGLLAERLLRPIHVIRSGLTRLGRGEFGVTLDLPPGDEFGELGSFFNTVSQQLSADRTALAGQKANLQVAVEHLEDAVALINPAGELIFSNPAMQATLGTDAIGKPIATLLPGGNPARTIIEETLASHQSRGPVQVSVHEDLELLLMTQMITGTDGELVGVLLVARNVAYMSRVQSMLAYSRKLVALGRLTAGIAHEVKNPLNAMIIHLELLRTKIRNFASVAQPQAVAAAATGTLGLSSTPAVAPALPPAAQSALEHVEIIESEIRRLDGVVQGFLKFTRPEDLRLAPVRVPEMLAAIQSVVEPEAKKNGVKVSMDCSAAIPPVNGDAGMLRQVFLNLAINACQAMPQGGSLRISCAPVSHQRVEVRLEDTGVGIAKEHLSKIFDLYFTTKDHGTGIGLSMVYRIVQLHDGEIEVESTQGRGTTFRVLLPQAAEV
jgi:signal transduction histidine kinase/HAMP domain-containing protein